MNLAQLAEAGPARKYTRLDGHVANDVEAHLQLICPELLNRPHVFITGGNVWQFLYGEQPSADSDIDVIMTGADVMDLDGEAYPGWKYRKAQLITQLELTPMASTRPSVGSRTDDTFDAEGMKYRCDKEGSPLYGRTVDIWHIPTINVALAGYPRHSHGHCRAAWSSEYGALIVMPNTGVHDAMADSHSPRAEDFEF